MLNDEYLLKLVRCPESHQSLHYATPAVVASLNAKIASKALCNKAGLPVEKVLSGGLMREDGKVLYPIFDDIPSLLPDEGIPVSDA